MSDYDFTEYKFTRKPTLGVMDKWHWQAGKKECITGKYSSSNAANFIWKEPVDITGQNHNKYSKYIIDSIQYCPL